MGAVTLNLRVATLPDLGSALIKVGDHVDLTDRAYIVRYRNAVITGFSEQGYMVVRLPGQKQTVELSPESGLTIRKIFPVKVRRRGR